MGTQTGKGLTTSSPSGFTTKTNTSVLSAVVCREYDSRYESRFRNPPLVMTPTVICSYQCREGFPCTACEAARATSAAPTYFSKQKIGENAFIDGGLGYNNPSWAAYDHYNGRNRTSHASTSLDGARMINIGTGTPSPTPPPPPASPPS